MKEEKKKNKSQFRDVLYNTIAVMMAIACIYLQLFVSTHLEDIDTPLNYIAFMTLIICNGLLAVYFFGKPEKSDKE